MDLLCSKTTNIHVAINLLPNPVDNSKELYKINNLLSLILQLKINIHTINNLLDHLSSSSDVVLQVCALLLL